MSLNHHSPIPLYQQLAEHIRQAIAADVYPVNAKIPSEHEFVRQFDIGRPTVRQATDLLVREGVLQRKRGSGTFVLPPTKQIDLFSLAGTSAAFNQSELDAETSIIAPAKLISGTQLPAALEGRNAYRLKRLSSIAGEPVLLEVVYLDAGLFQQFDQQKISGDSLSRIAKDVYFLEASSADQAFSIAYPDKAIAHTMKTNTQTPLLQVARTLHFGEHRAAIYCDIYCRTDRFHFSQEIFAANIPTLSTPKQPSTLVQGIKQ